MVFMICTLICAYYKNIEDWGLYYKTFYGHNLRIFVINQSVGPYPQTLDQAGEAYPGQTLQLITKIRKLRP